MEKAKRASAVPSFAACTQSEYSELTRLLDVCFQTPEKNWFPKNYCHIFQNDPKHIRNNYVVRVDGEMAGAIGIYPYKLRIGSAELTVGGVGSVGTLPRYRGTGIMSFMLENVNTILSERNFDISWLSGDRYRYSNYGWEVCGRRAEYQIQSRNLKRIDPDYRHLRLRKAVAGDIPRMAKAYGQLFSAVTRTRKEWALRLKRAKFDVYYASEGKLSCYLAAARKDTHAIAEIQGSPELVSGLLEAYMAKKKVHQVCVSYPFGPDAVGKVLYRLADTFACRHQSQIQIVNPEAVWEKLLGEIKKAHSHVESAKIKKLAGVSFSKDKAALLKRLFGFFNQEPSLPGKLRAYEWLRPLEWWMSDLDQV